MGLFESSLFIYKIVLDPVL